MSHPLAKRTVLITTFAPFPSSYLKTSALTPSKQNNLLVAPFNALSALVPDETMGDSSG